MTTKLSTGCYEGSVAVQNADRERESNAAFAIGTVPCREMLTRAERIL